MLFSDKYIELCAAKKKAVTTVSEELGYSRATGMKWASGSMPRKTALKKIADYFGVSVEYLTAEPEESKRIAFDTAIAQAGLVYAGVSDSGLPLYTTKGPSPNGDGLTENEQAVIDLFRRLGPDLQDAVIAQLRGLAQLVATQDSPE